MFDIRSLNNTAWLMEPLACESLHQRLATMTDWPTTQSLEAFRQEMATKALRKSTGGIAVMNIHGVIEPRLSMMSMVFGGGFSVEDGMETFDQLVKARDISTIVLSIDSPGGLSDLVPEFSDQIYAARDKKAVHSIANPVAASAAFWIGTQASSFSITPSGLTASLGVYTSHISFEKQLEAEGVQVTTVSSSGAPYKAELSPYKNLTDAGREHLQMMVDETHEQFTAAVARGMGVSIGTVRSSFGKGRVLSAQQAVDVGAATRVVSFRDFMSKLQNGSQPSTSGHRAAVSAAVLRMRQDQRKRNVEMYERLRTK